PSPVWLAAISRRTRYCVKFSRRDCDSVSTFGFSMTGGHGPIKPCHVSRISCRRRGQSAADRRGVPSLNSSGERYGPNFSANSGGGWKNGAIVRHAAVGSSAATGGLPQVTIHKPAKATRRRRFADPLTAHFPSFGAGLRRVYS